MRRRGRSQKGPDPRRRTTLFLFFLQHNHCVADHSRPQSGDGADNATDHRIDPTAEKNTSRPPPPRKPARAPMESPKNIKPA